VEGQPIVSRRDDPDTFLKLLNLKEMQTRKGCFLAAEIRKNTQGIPHPLVANWLKNTHGVQNDPNLAAKQAIFDE
jgi:hypothetical protein